MLDVFQGKNSGNLMRQVTFHWLYTIPISVEPPPSTKYGAHTALSQSTSSQNTVSLCLLGSQEGTVLLGGHGKKEVLWHC